MTRIARDVRAGATAAGVFAATATAYTVLGLDVAHAPVRGIDAAARAVAGEAPAVAWILTASCLWPALTAFGAIGCIVALRVRVWRGRIAFAILTTLAAWQISNALKDVFMRPRPSYWVLHHETSFAYSSGHAMFATVVYWLWAYHVAGGGAPAAVRIPLCVLLAAWGGAVIWSRLALGAHYPTDLLGGVLLAIAMLAAARVVAAVVAPGSRVLE